MFFSTSFSLWYRLDATDRIVEVRLDVPIRFVALDVCPECSGRLFERLGARSGEGRSDGEE
jgi:hypothetical protein